MADEALLASARVYPSRLISSGFKFTYPKLESALAAAIA
jgi:NAD dependent epimerase/dehydratase family enzyme